MVDETQDQAEILRKKIETKFKMLDIKEKENKRILERKKIKELEKHANEIETRVEEIQDLKGKVQELMLESEKEMDEIDEWTHQVEEKLEKYDQPLENVQNLMKELQTADRLEQLKEQENMEEVRKQRRYKEELEIEEIKLKMRREYDKETKSKAENEKTVSQVKLPKLTISKFEGTHLDWQRFWSQFESEIDHAEFAQVTKFNFLKEMLKPKVRNLIDGLPFTTEGYERAKNILKSKYGKDSEVANAHIQSLISLPTITSSNPLKINEFYEKLVTHVQALDTMGKLKEIKGYVRLTLDKLTSIKSDLVRTDDEWHDWDFETLTKELSKWIDRNPVKTEPKHDQKREHLLKTHQKDAKPSIKPCVYCSADNHKSSECEKVKGMHERKKVLSEKKLCFNCTGSHHRASECKSKRSCQICQRKHHTSICDKPSNMMMATEGLVIHPVVVVKVNNIMCRALLDTGAGSSYASAALLDRLNIRPTKKETKNIDMMMSSTTRKLEIYDVEISEISEKFKISTTVYKVDKSMLLTLPNPKYKEIINRYQHLDGIKMNDIDTKPELPVHMVLGASDYAKIKVQEMPKIGSPGEPVAELTHFGWVIMSPGDEIDINNLMLSRTSIDDYDKLCNLDVLGVQDIPKSHDDIIHTDFKEQLKQSDEGWYETGLMWKQGKENLRNNETGSLKRLQNLIVKLQKSPELLETYDSIINNQLEQGIIEKVDKTTPPKIPEFFLPHKPVIRENAESTKVRIVYDASARADNQSKSLNEYLESGPNLQNQIWKILARTRFNPVALCGDIKQAFLQIRIHETCRDALRFHWIIDRDPQQIGIYRFTRLVFGLTQSPFVLDATVQHHLEKYENDYKELVSQIKEDLYVDDLISGGDKLANVKLLKDTAIQIFKEAGFVLHKWHSNCHELEENDSSQKSTEQTYAKQTLGVETGETKMLGIKWDKKQDKFDIEIPPPIKKVTKRNILQKLASIYDVLGFISPCTLVAKDIFRKVCDQKIPWDKELPPELLNKWLTWENVLPSYIEIPRPITSIQEKISEIELHLFGDASITGTSAVAYAVIQQPSSTVQGFISSKSRLSKKNTSIPRLELIAAVMVVNLAENIQKALSHFKISAVHGWSDSMVVLHWLNGNGSYKQFVQNRLDHINAKAPIQWHYVSTDKNPADIGSRGCKTNKLPKLWFDGPTWLQKSEEWPKQKDIVPTKESEAEAKQMKEVFYTAKVDESQVDTLVNKFEFRKTVRVVSWIKRFSHNAKSKEKQKGPLKTQEINTSIETLVRREQNKFEVTESFQNDVKQLNLIRNEREVYKCHGRIQGDYPIYIPRSTMLAERLIQHYHKKTLHGGVILTMTAVREQYWIPKLRQLTKRVIKNCYGCKRYHSKPYDAPPLGQLTKDRTTGTRAFQVIGLDFAGPLMYKKGNSKQNKSYILLFTCSLSRAIHLELVPNQTTEEFIRAFKRLIARRGVPEKIYSDNAKTFIAACKWLKKLNKSEEMNNFFNFNNIEWKFNLSRAPWWGGQFERMVGLVKNTLYKTLGKATLSWRELEEVLLDIENTLNNRPLTYVEDDIEYPILTPNILVIGQNLSLPENDLETADSELSKRFKYIRKCKESAWFRWRKEYIKSLRERHNMKTKDQKSLAKIGEVVIIHSDDRNKGKWTLGIIKDVFPGPDNIVRAVRIKTSKSYLERAVQHLYPLELSCDINIDESYQSDKNLEAENDTLNPEAREFLSRRNAAAIAKLKISDVVQHENKRPPVE